MPILVAVRRAMAHKARPRKRIDSCLTPTSGSQIRNGGSSMGRRFLLCSTLIPDALAATAS